MAICEEDRSATYLQTGPYGKVSLIEGTVKCLAIQPAESIIKQVAVTTEGFPSRLFHRGRRDVPLASLQRAIVVINHRALVHHQLGDDDVGWLSSHREPMLTPALWFNGFIGMYWRRYSEMITSDPFKKEKPPYTLGRYLADIFGVLPAPVSASVLRAASDSPTSRDISAMSRSGSAIFQNYGNRTDDNQSYAVEATVLLPRNVRLDIFREMTRFSPGRIGGAGRFLDLIISHWANLLSPYGGIAAINRNLSPEEASRQILEVQEDFPLIRQIK